MSERDERQHIVAQLSEYALGVLQEWMRIVELEDPEEIPFQARLRWQDDGTALMGETQYSEEYGRFRFTVSVEDLELERAVINALRGNDTGEPLGILNDPGIKIKIKDAPSLVWVTRTWDDVRTGDVVRMPGSDVTATIAERRWPPTDSHRGRNSMHVTSDGTREKWAHTRDHVVQEGECVIRFTTDDPPEQTRYMIPAAPVEIQMDRDTATVLDSVFHGGWGARERTITS